jgi:hypothetical protein
MVLLSLPPRSYGRGVAVAAQRNERAKEFRVSEVIALGMSADLHVYVELLT